MAKEDKKEDKKEDLKTRQIIIETDGNTIQIKTAEVAGILELRAILTSLIGYCDQQSK